jgi:hypothetical protein
MIDGMATLTIVASMMISATPRLSIARPSHFLRAVLKISHLVDSLSRSVSVIVVPYPETPPGTGALGFPYRGRPG